MPGTDLSLVVTAHNETTVCGPTMRSADLAVAAARDAGFTVECIIALDNATDACREYFHQSAFDHWDRWDIAQGDLGRTRNEVVPKCAGRHIAFLDSDDLFSENWLREGLRLLVDAETTGDRLIVHPELNWLFDGENSVFVKIDQDSPLFSPHHFAFTNYYDSLCMAPREAHLDIPYVHRDIPNGLSFQDWQFSVETMAAGWRHVSARDTIIFKRRRDASLVTESRGRKSILRSIEPLAIDRIGALGREQ
ncbi:glycosyltransferase [Roseovarius salinarum]|uniref:glycosyltransferase n=1 Tax=Roseovarius salinarum TaxID=1981892 RepID=UPI0012FFDD4D|nr:glycosyltransferase family A protein [Roseovarius salinarum]